jgi:hypothetical protein
MDLKNDIELANTRKKLQHLEALYEEDKRDSDDDEELREVSMQSIKRLINQLKEEIARYEAHQPTRR